MVEIVAHHLRNVEVHHVDLDIGYLASFPDIGASRAALRASAHTGLR